ncbi:hypothetical protein OPKNFCMD_0223 [Methylobacterium crusticola]|uniref:Uncharacterized protein n=1 Tax=Methylobacterium crusticola TaxID=1697972 RepID=A0ABQ4QRW0_9HYPH|nr:hypothetical protein [Methylobacterium crusticola]GJD47515.1 hypothetical protein OPKNFCMD_0223 [Methylobacterium crusticola]
MAQTSFDIDEKTASALNSLKETYGVSSNAAVLRRALAIALAASQYADDDHNIHLLNATDEGIKREVILPQRY